jgi:hypothetical protein
MVGLRRNRVKETGVNRAKSLKNRRLSILVVYFKVYFFPQICLCFAMVKKKPVKSAWPIPEIMSIKSHLDRCESLDYIP